MARYPLMHTSSRLLDPMIVRHLKQRKMKGGTIFGTSTRMRRGDPMKVLAADQDKARMTRWLRQRMKGGKIFGTLFGKGDPRKVWWANQAKARRQRRQKGIKRGRR